MADLLDIDPETRRALELDGVLDWIAGLARTVGGSEAMRRLAPSADPAWIAAEHAAVDEARRWLGARGRLLARRLPDPAPALGALAVAGRRPDVETLRGLAFVLRAAGDARRAVEDSGVERWSALASVAARLPDFDADAHRVLAGSDAEGRITDEASPELARIRATRQRTAERLRTMLESLVHDPDLEHVVQDDFVTQRNGRWVVPVRTDSPKPLRGIVHASSSSGRTVFVEPLESVDLNNEIVRLSEAEREEEERIVTAWCDAFRERLAEAREAVDGVSRLDGLQARALFAEECGAVAPVVRAEGAFRCRGVRHPLLDRRLREQGGACVPLDLDLDPADRVVVLSGPNAGGKTVALKTFGLAVLLAQAGVPVAADEARLPLYGQARADIGDHQSIEADLSTFSAHLAAAVSILASRRAPALLLFDEIGTGTEPGEGAALAQALLEELQGPGVTAMATTHQGALKAWAFTTEGAVPAAMEFDDATLRPTFRILMGAAGASAGLSIAERLGMPAAVVERARERLGAAGGDAEALMTRLRDLAAEAERRREELIAERAAVDAERRRQEERFAEREERLEREAGRALDRALRELRESMRRELAGVADARERRRLERKAADAEGRVRAERDRLARGLGGPGRGEGAGWVVPDRVEAGQTVLVRSLGREGEVVRADGDRVEVRLGRMPFTVQRDDLRVAGAGGTDGGRAEAPADRTTRGAPARTGAAAPSGDDLPREVMLIGMRVEEGLEALDRHLDAAAVAGHEEIRVVHGHGTGRLRRAVREFLRGHPLVARVRAGGDGEGGDGATVATLR